jgi:flagellar basal-body rod protein FlgC
MPVFEPVAVDGGGEGVKLARVAPDSTDFKLEYAPGHPAADKNGYVKLPNINPMIEALDMREAQRAYQANLNVIEAARSMQSHILELLKK